MNLSIHNARVSIGLFTTEGLNNKYSYTLISRRDRSWVVVTDLILKYEKGWNLQHGNFLFSSFVRKSLLLIFLPSCGPLGPKCQPLLTLNHWSFNHARGLSLLCIAWRMVARPRIRRAPQENAAQGNLGVCMATGIWYIIQIKGPFGLFTFV